MTDKKIFSVVMPIYNVEEYLEEAIESVINQDIGFKENIELILINDGSPDNSDEICVKYKEKYPDNIIYVKQKNAGVSSARNKGLELAHGEYINFIDSDDKWEPNVFSKALKMFNNHPEIDVIGVRLKFFDGLENYHVLDYKFDEDKVVDLKEDYDHIQLSSASCFIRRKAIGDLKFDTKLKYSEDVKFVTEIVIKKEKLGILASCLYLYRKRLNETSAIQTKSANESWYLTTPERCYKYLINLSKEKFGFVHPYIQYCIAYDYQWRVKEDIPSSISKDVVKKYLKITKEIYQDLDDKIILEQKKLYTEYKICILKDKYGKDFYNHITNKDNMIYFDDQELYSISNRNILKISSLNVVEDNLILKGMSNCILPKDEYKLIVKVNNEEKEIKLFDTTRNVRKYFNNEIFHNMGVNESFKIKPGMNIRFYIKYNNKNFKLYPKLDLFSKLNQKLLTTYVKSNIAIKYRKGNIIIQKNNKLKYFLKELRLILILLLKFKYKQALYRFCYHIFKIFKKKDIWLISDRTMVANDNGMHLFKYAVKHNKKDDIYYVLNKKSDDFEKMKKIGKVLAHGTFKYKLYFLLSKAVISSQADVWVYNPFGRSYKYYKDLFKFKLIFLQHGITQNDISGWLNVYNKDFSMFVTAAEREYESIINNDSYGYKSDVVKLTGFPRFDNLNSDPKKQIAIMPTWRKNISGKNNKLTGIREYNEEFKNTDYFKFYNDLINDERLLSLMKEKGYSGIFVVHPSHMTNGVDFKGNDIFKVATGFADYQKIFKESDLLITDYSSVHFDFAYMKKPVIYTQFDKEEFFGKHLWSEGYFSYVDDGFGPVAFNYKDSVNQIIKAIENDCKMNKKYMNRVDSFYKYTDRNNCKRVYDEIVKKIEE